MTTETIAPPTLDELRAAHAAAERDLDAKRAELAGLPDRLRQESRRAAHTGDLDAVKTLQAEQLVLPEVIAALGERAEAALRAVEDRELAGLHAALTGASPDVERARAALDAAQGEFQRAAAVWQNAEAILNATRENVMRRRVGRR